MFRTFLPLFVFSFACLRLQASCPCDSIPGFQSAYEAANVVFTGEPASIIPNWVSGGMKVTFKVDESWKRSVEDYFTINVPEVANCGVAFRQKEKYLVFVYKNHSFQTDSCNRTKQVSLAQEDLKLLGQSMKPTTNASIKKWVFTMGGLVLGGLAFIAFVVFRKKMFPPKVR